jgi:hypothetical protein
MISIGYGLALEVCSASGSLDKATAFPQQPSPDLGLIPAALGFISLPLTLLCGVARLAGRPAQGTLEDLPP